MVERILMRRPLFSQVVLGSLLLACFVGSGCSINRYALNKAADACKVFKEFEDVYGTRAPADLKTRVTKGRADAKCAA